MGSMRLWSHRKDGTDVGKHSAPGRSPLPLVLGIVAVLAIAAAAFFGFRILTGSNGASQASELPTTTTSSGSTTTATSSTASASPTETISAEAAAVQKALQDCVSRQDAAKAVIDSSATGADHWSTHLQGQTDIQSGAKTYIDVKTNVFGPTKAAGPGDIAAYDSAVNAYNAASSCQNVSGMPSPAELTPKLQACAAREQAIEAYMVAAKAVMDDWRTHLREMADHSDGHLNGPDAQAKWIDRWRAAPAHLDPFRAAQSALNAAPACTA
jgi:hypothetical protein